MWALTIYGASKTCFHGVKHKCVLWRLLVKYSWTTHQNALCVCLWSSKCAECISSPNGMQREQVLEIFIFFVSLLSSWLPDSLKLWCIAVLFLYDHCQLIISEIPWNRYQELGKTIGQHCRFSTGCLSSRKQCSFPKCLEVVLLLVPHWQRQC